MTTVVETPGRVFRGWFVCNCVRHISYLPLAHIYERMNMIVMLHHGVAVGFFQGVRSQSFVVPNYL